MAVRHEPLHKDECGLFRRIAFDRNTVNIGLALVIGLLAGFGAVGFRHLIWLFQELFYGTHTSTLDAVCCMAWWWRLVIPAGGGLVVGLLVWFLAREAKGHGVPEVMEAVAFQGGVIRKRIVAIKALASAICIASGGSAGREGPIVHIGSAIGSAFGQITKVGRKRMKTLVACGASAGIAATFNAPIAGAFFALEVILGNFAFASFGPVILSSVVATAVSREFFGKSPAFNIPVFASVSIMDYPFALVLGIIAGFAGLLFVITLYKSEDIFELVRIPLYIKAAVGGLLIGLVGLEFPYILGVGYETIGGILDPAAMAGVTNPLGMGLLFMLLLFAFKLLGTSLTLGSGGSGGIFAPSLFMGAMLGAVFAMAIRQVTGLEVSIPLYAMLGMGALTSASTHASITSILIIFEMTGDYKIILPLMAACIASTFIAKAVMRDSIYTMKLSRRGVGIHGLAEELVMARLVVKEHLNPEFKILPESMLLRDVLKLMTADPHDCYPVIHESGEMMGVLYFQDVKKFIFEEGAGDVIIAGDLCEEDVPLVFTTDNFRTAMNKLVKHDVQELPVVDSDEPKKPLGVISRRDILYEYSNELMKEQ